MELILKDACYKNIIKGVNYTFKDGITLLNGIDGKLLQELLFQDKTLDKGKIMISSYGTKKDVVLVDLSYNYNKEYVLEEFMFYNNLYHLNYKKVLNKAIESLKMANLDEIIIEKKNSELSMVELKKLNLALALFINPKIFILNYYEKELSNCEINYFNKLILKLNKNYGKNIIIITDEIKYYMNTIDNILVVNKSIVFEGTKKDIYDDKIYKYIKEPEIISFIKLVNKKGHKIDNYIDIKELIKAIYRDVENS